MIIRGAIAWSPRPPARIPGTPNKKVEKAGNGADQERTSPLTVKGVPPVFIERSKCSASRHEHNGQIPEDGTMVFEQMAALFNQLPWTLYCTCMKFSREVSLRNILFSIQGPHCSCYLQCFSTTLHQARRLEMVKWARLQSLTTDHMFPNFPKDASCRENKKTAKP